MNNIKVKVYKKILKEVAENIINNRIDEICSQEKLSAEEVIYFLVSFLQFMIPCQLFRFLAVKWFLDMKYKKPLWLRVG